MNIRITLQRRGFVRKFSLWVPLFSSEPTELMLLAADLNQCVADDIVELDAVQDFQRAEADDGISLMMFDTDPWAQKVVK